MSSRGKSQCFLAFAIIKTATGHVELFLRGAGRLQNGQGQQGSGTQGSELVTEANEPEIAPPPPDSRPRQEDMCSVKKRHHTMYFTMLIVCSVIQKVALTVNVIFREMRRNFRMMRPLVTSRHFHDNCGEGEKKHVVLTSWTAPAAFNPPGKVQTAVQNSRGRKSSNIIVRNGHRLFSPQVTKLQLRRANLKLLTSYSPTAYVSLDKYIRPMRVNCI